MPIPAPGLTKERGLILYELYSVDFHLLKMQIEQNDDKEQQDLDRLHSWSLRCLGYLSECKRCLKKERPDSLEGRVLKAAREASESCKEMVEVLSIIAKQQEKI